MSRFHEEASTDVVIQFPGWSGISIAKPNTDEGRFTSFFTREQVEDKLARLRVPHHTVVISYKFTYTEQEQAEHQQAWGAILKKLGFQRVVFVVGQREGTVNGAYTLRDMALTDESSPAVAEPALAHVSDLQQ